MGKLITVTTNTAIDSLVIIQPSGAQECVRFPAGKGINVARTVATLGGRVVALGFVGEGESPLFSGLSSDLIDVQLIRVPGVTRTNTTTFDPSHKVTDHTRVQGFEVSSDAWLRLIQQLDAIIESDDIVIISGSLPRGSEIGKYRTLIGVCKRHRVRVILDSSGPELIKGAEEIPFMIKPNIEELGELMPSSKLSSQSAIVTAAKDCWRRGIELVVISRGASGTIVVHGTEPKCSKLSVRLDAPASPTGSVGSGDALVAGTAFGLTTGLSVIESVTLGTACGAANVLTTGPGVCRRADIERLRQIVLLEDVIA